MTTVLPDTADVRAALRLGWLMAEVRGRARPGGPGTHLVADMARDHWVLPLGSERSAAELGVEAGHALAAVAKRLGADGPAPARAAAPPGPAYSEEVSRLGGLIADQRRQQDPQELATWDQLAQLLYLWDARIQDELLSSSDRLANAYELGRVLAEAYWALDPAAPPQVPQDEPTRLNPVSWEFLLGPGRRADAAQMLGRLAPYFAPLAAPAVAGSLEVWGQVAASQQWRVAEGAHDVLLQQARNWYSLLVTGLDPETMLRPYALLRSWSIFRKVFRVFGLELVIGAAGLAAITALVLLFVYAPHQPALKAVTAVLGAFGVSSAGLQARLKATTQSIVTRLSADLSTELVAEQITVTPSPPRGIKIKRMRRDAIASRTVTAPLSR